mgnify:CR=1 FL=1
MVFQITKSEARTLAIIVLLAALIVIGIILE